MVNNTEELAQNKLILLYIIDKAPIFFTRIELNEFVLEKNYMNYFFLQQYLAELIDSQFINLVKINDEEVIKISDKGKLVLNYFLSKIPSKLKSELEIEFNNIENKRQKDAEVISEFYPKENGQYIVNLKLVEKEDTLFSLYLNVTSLEQAEYICKSWETNTNEIYQNVFKMLIKE